LKKYTFWKKKRFYIIQLYFILLSCLADSIWETEKKLVLLSDIFRSFREKNLNHTGVTRSNWSCSCHNRETRIFLRSFSCNLSFTVLQWTSGGGEFVGACFPFLPRFTTYAIPTCHRFVVGQKGERQLEFLPRSEDAPWAIRPWILFIKKVFRRRDFQRKDKYTLIL